MLKLPLIKKKYCILDVARQMISSCLNKREVIKVFSAGRRCESEEEEERKKGSSCFYVLVGGQFIGGCNEPIKMHWLSREKRADSPD